MFPDPRIREAYLSPVVDLSPEPFKWALPDITALQAFLHSRLSWGPHKCNEILMPVVKRVTQARALIASGEGARTQTTLDGFVTRQGLPDLTKSGGRTNSKRVAKAVGRLRGDPSVEAAAPPPKKKKAKPKAAPTTPTKKRAAEGPKKTRKKQKTAPSSPTMLPDSAVPDFVAHHADDLPSIPSDSDLDLFEEVAAIEEEHQAASPRVQRDVAM